VTGLALISLLATAHARAQAEANEERTVSLGAGVHLLSSVGSVCEQSGDVIGCHDFAPFAGADLSGHYWPVTWLALGVRVSGSKDLDASASASSTGESSDRDQWLWRFSAELRIDPPILPHGMWLGAELGAAVLVDSLDEFNAAGSAIASHSATQSALLLGLPLGWDFLELSKHALLGLDARAQWIAFGDDPPQLQTDIASQQFGSALWLALGARFTYQW
jgi:hypothetical protein